MYQDHGQLHRPVHFVKLFTSVSQQHTVSLSQRHNDNRQYLWLYGERMELLYYNKQQLESYKWFDFWSLKSGGSSWRLCCASAPWTAPAQMGAHYTLQSAHYKTKSVIETQLSCLLKGKLSLSTQPPLFLQHTHCFKAALQR